MPKAKEATEPSVSAERILYDSRESQTFGFALYQRGREIPITHTISPVDDARFFKMAEEIDLATDRITRSKRITSDIYVPKEKVWDEHVHESTGYGDRADWKQRVSQDDKIGIVNAYFEVEPDDEPEAEGDSGELVYDFDAHTPIYFWCRFGSAKLLGMVHKFREFTKPEKDEYLALATNQPTDARLSNEKASKVERLANLGRKLLKETEGYAEGSHVPAWHLAATTEMYFTREIARQGKF